MKSKECSLVQELMPLYAENLIGAETAEHIKRHLANCADCAQEWENFILPLPNPFAMEKLTPTQGAENKLLARLKKTIIAVVLLIFLSGMGLAYASYTAGKNVGLEDPAYRFAKELDLFTEIKQTQTIGSLQATLNKGLFDSTRSVLFIDFSSPIKIMPQINLIDDTGQQYEQKSGKGWQSKYYMLEFEPVDLETQELTVTLSLDDAAQAQAEFTFPVDVAKIAQYTKIVYPNQEKKISDLKVSFEKAVLGVSESEFKVRFDWPVDGSVAGISLGRGGAYFPTSVTKVPATPPPPGMGAPPPGGLMSSYAATYGVNYRPQDPPENRPALYDLTGRQEVQVEEGEYRTTQFPCQVVATLKFAPMKRETEQMELLLPPVYLYKKIEEHREIHLNFEDKNELVLDRNIAFPQGKVVIEKAWLEKNTVYLSCSIETSATPETILPHFVLTDNQGMEQGQLSFDRENPQLIMFSLYNEKTQELCLSLDSIGQLLTRENFTLDLRDNN
ncbi:MAG TPA: hypothetical protein GX711_06695 [Clostridia bacterium]|nr:hypothetical protein [Clostridia bacterium]